MTPDRSYVEKIVEQELSGILLQSLRRAEKEGKPHVKEALLMILLTIDARREEREKAGADERQG